MKNTVIDERDDARCVGEGSGLAWAQHKPQGGDKARRAALTALDSQALGCDPITLLIQHIVYSAMSSD